MRDFILQDEELVKNENVYFVFLIRNPHHATISFYKKNKVVNNDASKELLTKLIGYEPCYELFDYVKQEAVNAPAIMLSEDLYVAPRATLQSLYKFLDMPFKDQMLQWSDLGDSFVGAEWSEVMQLETAYLWHEDAIKSTSFKQPAQYLVDELGQPTFEEIIEEERRDAYRSAYLEQLPFYNQFFSEQNVSAILKRS